MALLVLVGLRRVWGQVPVGAPEQLLSNTEARMSGSAEPVATAIANAATRDKLRELAEQQAALRRVATLVARGASPSEVFAAVAEEMVNCLHVENAGISRYDADDEAVTIVSVQFEPPLDQAAALGSRWSLEGHNYPLAEVLLSGRPIRWYSHDDATGPLITRTREIGFRSVVMVPIVVDGRVWGSAAVASSKPEPLPVDTEERITDFTELVTTAIANAAARDELQASRDELAELAEQQAALRRVATLVARGVASSEVFSAVATELARCARVSHASLCRYEPDGTAVVLAAHGATRLPIGGRFSAEGLSAASLVWRTGRAARVHSYQDAPGPTAARLRELGLRSGVGAPIIVDGHLWGVATVASGRPEPMPPVTEARVADFAELVATAIANATARDELRELAEQQAALRRVATLVARGVGSAELFNAVADEMALCLHVENAAVIRYEPDGTANFVSGHYEPRPDRSPVGERFSLEGDNIPARVLDTGCAARMDDHDNATGTLAALAREQGLSCVVGTPILVDGRVWGTAIVASSQPEPLPADTEARLGDFAELLATAIANATNRDELQASRDTLRELAGRQAALRRVATLVARGARPSEVYSAVADEIVNCLDVDSSGVWRYESDDAITLLAGTSEAGVQYFPVGERLTIEGDNLGAMVLSSGRAARHHWFENDAGSAIARIRELGIREGVGAPIIVEGRVWGLAVAATTRPEPLPPDTEERLGDFADLVATALVNAVTNDELIASRARIVAAADDARRRIERDLHDGAQQRLVSLGLRLRLAEDKVPAELGDVRECLSSVVSEVTAISSELQRISRGIHPAIQSEGGLGPALKLLARQCPVPVRVDVVKQRLPDPVEVAAYYVVAEALTNTAKYAQASVVKVCAEIKGANLVVSVDDDGIGGAESSKGSGLIGLKDRVEVLGGHMNVVSPPGIGTSLHVTIPLPAE